MLKKLFSSQLRVDLLSLFFMNPGREYYLRELISILNNSPQPVSNEIKNLVSVELITKRISGNQHYYQINTDHQLYEDLRNIFVKTVGLRDIVAKFLKPYFNDLLFAFIYGSMARGNFNTKSDIDLMLIGDKSPRAISGACLKIGEVLKREVNYSVFTIKEVKQRLADQNHFMTSLMDEKKIFITGNQDEFERLGRTT